MKSENNARTLSPVHNSNHGFRGIEWNPTKQKFRARIGAGDNRKHLGYFDTAEEAAQAYDNAARHRYESEAVLNFPGTGENQVIPSRKSNWLCPKGHDLNKYGYLHKRGINCRKCNAVSVARCKQRKRDALSRPVHISGAA